MKHPALVELQRAAATSKAALAQRVAVKAGEAGRLDIKHLAEIQHMPAYADEFWKLYDGETLLAEWHTPEATP
ncbi:hypothetical protein [Janthinobacterium sp. PSPC1-1]|uniref:hypothetical protein n=1 Tax=Janthinobacterium sp. PSPC1-1 TaxID=2804581 RepID=UPI003CF52F89